MVKLNILYDHMRWEEKALYTACEKRGIDFSMIDAERLFLDLTSIERPEGLGEVVLQRCVSHFRGLHLTFFVFITSLTVINSYSVSSLCGNKMLTSITLAKNGIPTPKTIVAFTKEEAMRAAEELGFPSVIKPVFGSWGRLIAPLKDRETAQAILEHREEMGNPLYQIYYVQEMIKRPPRDIRTVVVGEEIVAAIYRYSAPEDWRTT
jgi:[lysine-biosynthesis-protein LysW]--L-2-aminoadipate ligase